MIRIKVAKLVIGIDNKHEYIRRQVAGYVTEEEPTFTVCASDEEIAAEMLRNDNKCSPGYCESFIIYRKIAAYIPQLDAYVFHGSVIECAGRAYLITASSGVGKTTHTRLWLSEFPNDTSIINGDKPIIRIIDGVPYACGTPWNGKEGYGKNAMCALAGIAFLERSEFNRAAAISTDDAVINFMKQIYLPKASKDAVSRSLALADKTLRSVRLVRLQCNMDAEAAHVCRAALIADE